MVGGAAAELKLVPSERRAAVIPLLATVDAGKTLSIYIYIYFKSI